MADLKSSTQSLGRYVTQIRHFSGGQERTFKGIDTTTIQDGTMCSMMCRDGRMLVVNVKNVDMIKVLAEQQDLQEITTNKIGRYASYIRHFDGGQKLTLLGVDTTSVKYGTMCKMMLKDGSMVMINTNNIDIIEIFAEEDDG